MRSDKRKSGLPLIGELPWGTHFCHFYQRTEDLLAILLPYFRAGLESNEFCVWVTSGTRDHEDAERALQEAAPRLAHYVDRGQLEILPYGQWQALAGKSGSAVVSALDRAVFGGFDGLRVAFHACTQNDGDKTLAEDELDALSRLNALAVFAYPRDDFKAFELMAVTKSHRFALVRNAGGWDVIESSEARIARDDLKRSEEKLQSLFSHMSEGFAYHRIVLDAGGTPCDYIFLEINDAFERLTGLRAENTIGQRATQVLPGIENDPTDWIGTYGEVALTQKPVQFESYSEVLKRWYAVSAFSPHKGFFAVTFSDITERKRAEEALRESEERFRTTLASIGDAVIATDREGLITFVNAVAVSLTGWPLEEAIGRPVQNVFRVIDEKSRQPIPDLVGQVLREKRALTLTNNAALVARDGCDVPIEDSAAPILDAAGNLTGAVLVFRDVAAKRRAQEALRETVADLQQANRDLEMFNYSVSHDLKSPLAVLEGFASLLLADHADHLDEEACRFLGIIKDTTCKLHGMIEGLLALSRLGRQTLQQDRIDMEGLALAVVNDLQCLPANASVEVEVKPLAAALGDARMIRQVLINLLGNAMKFSGKNEHARIEVTSEVLDGHCAYHVRDNGVGFDMQYAGKLFGIFQRLHREEEFEGNGLGLAICQRIIERHGGRIWAESRPGQGAVFSFTLPFQAEAL